MSEREIQQNNGAPMGEGQPRRGKKQKKQPTGVPQFAQAMGQIIPPMGQPSLKPPMGEMSPMQQPPQMGHDQLRAAIMGQPQQPNAGMPPPGVPQIQSQQPPQRDRMNLGGYQGTGNMLGFNTALDYDNDSAKGSMKNVFGQIASRYKAAPSMLDAVMNDPDFKQFFPNARKVEGGVGDKIDFGGQQDWHSGAQVGVVDVGGAFDPSNDSGAGWTWQDLANAEAQMMGPAPAQNIYEMAQNQMGTYGGPQMTQQLEGLDENTLMQLLQQLMSEDQQNGY